MKRLMVGVVVALIMAGVGRATASVVYDNGPINGTINSWAISPVDLSYDPDTLDIVPSVVSDSFTVTSPTTLTAAQNVGIWVDQGAAPSTVNWSIGTTPFASDVASGSNTAVSAALITLYGAYESSIYNVTVPLTGAVEPGPTYWLTLQNATATDDGYVYWDLNYGNSTAYATPVLSDNYPQDPTTGAIPSESFQLVDAVPEPTTILVWSLLGLVAVGYRVWRRRAA